MLDEGEYPPSPAAAELFGCANTLPSARKKKNKNKRRFSEEQIKSLESIFESESRLEPRKKLQLAKELGMQPRQVAIWFQNKRARWKSKQLERDYGILQANYNSLVSRFEILKKEKQALLIQLQKLHDLMKKTQEGSNSSSQDLALNSIDVASDNGDVTRSESEVKHTSSHERFEQGLGIHSDDDSSIKAEYLGLEEEANLLSTVEPVESSLTHPEDWSNLDANNLFDQSSSSYQWWDFWS